MIDIIEYNSSESEGVIQSLLPRNQIDYGDVQQNVSKIIKKIQKEGDKALFEYIEKFDKIKITSQNIKVSEKEINEAYAQIDKDLIQIIKNAIQRIEAFHIKQKQNSWFDSSKEGEILGQIVRPIQKAGVYVPGGKAAYPSSVLMNVIPAKVAGVEKITMATPVGEEGRINCATIVAAKEAGVTDIYKVGGAQAVAALAFGTESIEKVDKIVGPGNIYVALAKREVFGYVGIDSIAGPSEILIIADETANSKFVAADLLSQAEHDELASAILITTSKKLAEDVQQELENQLSKLPRKKIAEQSIKSYSKIILVKDLTNAADLSNKIAPEHLEICTQQPFDILPKIKNAGAIFLGHFTPEPLGDYMAGPNHVLPTSGTSRFFSPLSVDDFIKKTSVLYFSEEGLKSLGSDVIKFAESEGLTAHGNSIRVRMNG